MSSARLVRGSVSNPAGGAPAGAINPPTTTASPGDALRVPPIDEALIRHLEGVYNQPVYRGICRRDVDRQVGHLEVIAYLKGQYELQQQK